MKFSSSLSILIERLECLSYVQSKSGVKMSHFNSKTICGKLSDINYLHATRVDPESLECPGIYIPCSQSTSPYNTICVHPEYKDDHCPITFLDVEVVEPLSRDDSIEDVGTNQLNQTSNQTASTNDTDAAHFYNETLRFVFSKDVDSLPITRTELSDGLPCVKQPGHRTQKEAKQRLEIERDVYSRCKPLDDGSKSVDDRYTNLLISTTEYELQVQANVIQTLRTLPRYENYVESLIDERKQNELQLYSRPTTSWSMECEKDHETSRAIFFHEIVETGLGNQTERQTFLRREYIGMNIFSVFMSHQIMFFVLPNLTMLIFALHYKTQEYNETQLSQIRCCVHIIMHIVHFFLIFEALWAAWKVYRFLRLVEGDDIMDHLNKVQELIGCADPVYVTFDLEKVKSSIQDGDIRETGNTVIIICVLQGLFMGLYTVFYKQLVEEQQKLNAELFNPVHGQPFDPEQDAWQRDKPMTLELANQVQIGEAAEGTQQQTQQQNLANGMHGIPSLLPEMNQALPAEEIPPQNQEQSVAIEQQPQLIQDQNDQGVQAENQAQSPTDKTQSFSEKAHQKVSHNKSASKNQIQPEAQGVQDSNNVSSQEQD